MDPMQELTLLCLVSSAIGFVLIFGGAALLDAPRYSQVNSSWGDVANRFGLDFTREAPLQGARIFGSLEGRPIDCARGTSLLIYEWMGHDEDDPIWAPEKLISGHVIGQRVTLSLPLVAHSTIVAARGVRLHKTNVMVQVTPSISSFIIWADHASKSAGATQWLFSDDAMSSRLMNFAQQNVCVIELSKGQLQITIQQYGNTDVVGPAIELARELAIRIESRHN
jgi:hypothetical protein